MTINPSTVEAYPLPELNHRATNIEEPHHNQRSDVVQVVETLVNYMENNKNQATNWSNRDVTEAKKSITAFLTLEGLKGEDEKGLKHLSDWITEVEEHCTEDSMRVRMIKLKADKSIVKLLNLDDERQFKKTTWEELKKMLIARVPEFDPREAGKRLMKKNLTAGDDIEAFVARLHGEYIEICKATGLTEIRPGWSTILAHAIVGKMNYVSRAAYLNDIISHPEITI